MRIKFYQGHQRKFLDLVAERLNSPSIRGLLQFGFKINYSTLKNYYNESRLLPESLFIDMCEISGIDKKNFNFQLVNDNWGQIKGGKKGKRGKVISRKK